MAVVRLFRRTVVMDTEEVEVEVMEVAVPLAEVDTADAVVTVAAVVEEIKVWDLDCSRSEGFVLMILEISSLVSSDGLFAFFKIC